jgi:formylglycine-generating enzyme required for sulfatase activity
MRQLILAPISISLALGCRGSTSGGTQPLEHQRTAQDPVQERTSRGARAPAARAPAEGEDGNSRCVRVPAGVLNGNDIAELCMDITETTTAQYRQCVDAGKCAAPSEACANSLYYDPDRSEYPVNCVTQEQAAEYCAWQGKRLPTALEWQWAAQGGVEARPHPWGPQLVTCDHANLYFGKTIPPSAKGDCGRDWSPVGSYPRGASLHGVLDLQGNVSEWTSDGETANVNVKGVAANEDFSAEELDPALEVWADPAYPTSDIGFRCVREDRSEP